MPAELMGATIVAIGMLSPDQRIEGGGLAIDYIRPRDTQVRRVVFAFSEEGMWLHSGPEVISSSTMEVAQTPYE